ncbi:MAG: TRAP transporter small permease [Roseivivax sp.]|nr:TRAP transporter small permease [Roseivivax sp.]
MSPVFRFVEFAVGGVLLSVITALVFAAAVMRFFGHPLIWSVDLAQLLFIWLCFIGATKAMRERGHLGVDFLARLLPHRNRLMLETAVTAVTLAFFAILAVQGTKLTLLNTERAFGDSGLSYAYVTIAVPVGCVFLGLAMIANTAEAWRNRSGGTQLIYSRTQGAVDAATKTEL